MAKCFWCGRYFKDGTGYFPGLIGDANHFCSKRCYLECNAQEKVEDSEGGLWHFIKKVIKWIFIIFIGFIVVGMLLEGSGIFG